MMVSAMTPPQSNNYHTSSSNTHRLHFISKPPKNPSSSSLLLFTTPNSSSSPSSSLANNNSTSIHNPNPSPNFLSHVTHTTSSEDDDDDDAEEEEEEEAMVSSASAVASAIRRASTSPVQFMQRLDNDRRNSNLVLPSPDFQSLCLEQLDLFRRIVDHDALLSVYVRPAGSYVMDRLELRRVTGINEGDIVILISNFSVPTGLRVAEAALSNQQVEVIPECRALVFPMVKRPFIVGFLVAELPAMETDRQMHDLMHCLSPEEAYTLPSSSHLKSSEIQAFKNEPVKPCKFTAEQRLNAIQISRTLAMAYVMDQKAMLLQQSSWQNNVRMSNLVEQIRGPLSSIRTLSKMLSTHLKRSEISHDIVEDILVQGDHMKETLQQLQDAVYLTKANIMRYNEETLKKMHPESARSQLSNNFKNHSFGSKMQNSGEPLSLASSAMDLEMPMPPFSLAPLQQHDIRPCNVSGILADLVGAARPLADKQRRAVELRELCHSLQVAVEESALRQALSNLIEGALLRTHVGGKVEIVSTSTPAGGTLVVIDDDGPDMHYMTQMHSLTPFGADLLSEDMVEDNMTWNFVAGLTVAREILESYGCVIRAISPRITDAALGAGGTRIELWLPSFTVSDLSSPSQEV